MKARKLPLHTVQHRTPPRMHIETCGCQGKATNTSNSIRTKAKPICAFCIRPGKKNAVSQRLTASSHYWGTTSHKMQNATMLTCASSLPLSQVLRRLLASDKTYSALRNQTNRTPASRQTMLSAAYAVFSKWTIADILMRNTSV